MVKELKEHILRIVHSIIMLYLEYMKLIIFLNLFVGGMNTNNNYGISSPYLPLPYPPNYINNNNNGQQFNSVPLQQSHLQQPQLYNNNMQGSLEDQSQQLQQQQQQQQPYLNANPLYSNVNGKF